MFRIYYVAALAMALIGVAGPAAAKDLACFASRDQLICAGETGFKSYDKATARVRDRVGSLSAAVCGDTIYFADGLTLMSFDGAAFEEIFTVPDSLAAGPFGAAIDNIACYKDGPIWASWNLGISRWDQGEVTHYAAREIPGSKNVLSIAAGAGGRAWFSTVYATYEFSEGRWKKFTSYYGPLATDPQGRLFMGGNLFGEPDWHTIVVFHEGNKPTVAAKWPGAGLMQLHGFDSTGTLWTSAAASPSIFHFSDGKWTEVRLPVDATILDVRSDGAGGLYVTSDAGVGRRHGDGWEWRHPGNSNLPTSTLGDIAIAGRGRPLPPRAASRMGTVSGHLHWNDGTAVSNADVQICLSISVRTAGVESPCEGKLQIAQTITDSQGRFLFEGVAAGLYSMAVRPDRNGDRWFVAGSGEIELEPGQSIDAGNISLSRTKSDTRDNRPPKPTK